VNWLAGKKVLLVDDDPTIRDSMGLFFDAEGCRYTSVGSAERAIEELASGGYDLIISDYKLPGMDGLEFLGRIRESHPTIAKIFITAYGGPGLFSRAEQMGVSGCIEKPLTPEKVETCLALIGKVRIN
jgi:CheY-like chemotaxis protein